MTPISEACPYDDATRASRCDPCCAANGALTPCVLAYLRGQAPAPTSNIVPFHRVFLRDSRRAA
jgi:hypothetical protein